ncbi:hypothetical protein IMCC20628_02541 [Hoeflea sp. IMCC20628]|nr:hypothetical protein IMCC20628_02541 [Hoeflea sp. IMCC20628]
MFRFTTLVIVCSAAAFAAPSAVRHFAFGFSNAPDSKSVGFTNAPVRNPLACNIKGNVSIDTGERIYHVPGQKFYIPTKILPRYGERWFCTEAEARAAGWRKSRR